MTSNASDNRLDETGKYNGSTATTAARTAALGGRCRGSSRLTASARSSPKTISLFVEPGAGVDGTVNALRRACAGKAEILIIAKRGVRVNALEVFDRAIASKSGRQNIPKGAPTRGAPTNGQSFSAEKPIAKRAFFGCFLEVGHESGSGAGLGPIRCNRPDVFPIRIVSGRMVKVMKWNSGHREDTGWLWLS